MLGADASVIDFLKHHAISGDELERRTSQAADMQYWSALQTGLTIEELSTQDAGIISTVDQTNAAINDFRSTSYLSISPFFNIELIHQLSFGCSTIRRAGWPMAFLFLFDQIWALLRSPHLSELLTELLEPGYQMTPDFFVHHVTAAKGGAGFNPHRDGGNGATAVTCWIPLTSSTTENGCMYIVEPIPGLKDNLSRFGTGDPYQCHDVSLLLSATRALPIEPGGLLAWSPDILHWGGRYRSGKCERVSLSVEFTPAIYSNPDPTLRSALLPTASVPPFRDRLRWACQSVIMFADREPMLLRFHPVAHAILMRVVK